MKTVFKRDQDSASAIKHALQRRRCSSQLLLIYTNSTIKTLSASKTWKIIRTWPTSNRISIILMKLHKYMRYPDIVQTSKIISRKHLKSHKCRASPRWFMRRLLILVSRTSAIEKCRARLNLDPLTILALLLRFY